MTFACSPGLVLTGPNTSTCIENRKWEPDPRNIECKGTLLCFQDSIIPMPFIITQLTVVPLFFPQMATLSHTPVH